MSTEATSATWASRRGLSAGEKLVLLRLADVAGRDGRHIYIGVGSIAEDCEMDRRSVQRIMRSLEERGLIEVDAEARQHRSRAYRLVFAAFEPDAPDIDEEPEQFHVQGRQIVAPGSEHGAPGAAQGRPRGGAGAAPVSPDPDPDPDPISSSSSRDERVFSELRGVVEQICGWLTLSGRISDQVAVWSEHLKLGDPALIRTEAERVIASDPSVRGSRWRLVETIAGRAFAIRRDGGDPWRERPAASAGAGGGRGLPGGGARGGAGGGRGGTRGDGRRGVPAAAVPQREPDRLSDDELERALAGIGGAAPDV